MTVTELATLIAATVAILGALTTLWVKSRQTPADVRLAEAQAEKAEREADSLLLENLRNEIERLKTRISELESRLAQAEQRATFSETRLGEAEARAQEFRRAVIVIGERLDMEREGRRKDTEKLCLIVERLLVAIEYPERAKEVDLDAIRRLIATMRSHL